MLSSFAFIFNLRRYTMGNVWATDQPLALSVIAVCADMSNAAAGWATEITDMYGFKCRDGCYTCAMGWPREINVVCGEDQIITDIIKAAYAPVVGRRSLTVSKQEFESAPSFSA